MPLQLRTAISEDGVLELSLATVPKPEPGPEEVTIRVEASPINPSDLGLLFGPADMSRAEASGTAERPVVTAPVAEKLLRLVAGRLGQSLPAGNDSSSTIDCLKPG